MFEGAEKFNQSLNNWDTSNLRIMDYTFHGANSFDIKLNAKWWRYIYNPWANDV